MKFSSAMCHYKRCQHCCGVKQQQSALVVILFFSTFPFSLFSSFFSVLIRFLLARTNCSHQFCYFGRYFLPSPSSLSFYLPHAIVFIALLSCGFAKYLQKIFVLTTKCIVFVITTNSLISPLLLRTYTVPSLLSCFTFILYFMYLCIYFLFIFQYNQALGMEENLKSLIECSICCDYLDNVRCLSFSFLSFSPFLSFLSYPFSSFN